MPFLLRKSRNMQMSGTGKGAAVSRGISIRHRRLRDGRFLYGFGRLFCTEQENVPRAAKYIPDPGVTSAPGDVPGQMPRTQMKGDRTVMKPEEIIRQFTAEAGDFVNNPSRLDRLLAEAEAALRNIPNVGDTLSGLPVVIAMVKSWIRREYAVQPKVLATIIAAFLYLVKGKDLIPDSLPVVGMVDDTAVLMFALKIVEPELNAYRAWRDANRETV